MIFPEKVTIPNFNLFISASSSVYEGATMFTTTGFSDVTTTSKQKDNLREFSRKFEMSSFVWIKLKFYFFRGRHSWR